METLKLSVHQLVDFLLRKGSIDNRVFNRASMSEGSRLHRLYQSNQDADFLSEYPLKHEYYVDGVLIELNGFADGIRQNKFGEYCVEEIKTTVEELQVFKEENIAWHLGQAKCYALMFAQERKLERISIKIIYIRQGKEKERLVDLYNFSTTELEQDVITYLEDYLDFYSIIFRYNEKKMESINNLAFPFGKYRKGQRELSKYVYALASNGGRMFIEAPTGIGKTMSTLFPCIKALSLNDKGKIFYLTAKTSGKEAAYNAVNILKEKGLIINDIVITAKEKICPNGQKTCNPDECPFAKDYYTKLQAILRFALTNYSTFDYDLVNQIAFDNMICPFELQLDLSLFCDIIICDYNYLFDPISYMKRYFDEDSSHYMALIDEAHNLVDRSQNMYSASLSYNTFLKMKKSLRKVKSVKLKRRITSLNRMFEEINLTYEDDETIIEKLSDEYIDYLIDFNETYLAVNKDDHHLITKETTNFFLDVNRFLKIGELVNEKYLTYIRKNNEDITINYFCLDTSKFLHSLTNRIKLALFFSATFSPMDYYVNMLGGESGDACLSLPSPFPRENFEVLVAPKVSIKYKHRDESYESVRKYIKTFVSSKIGNYFIYSPSYEYMHKLLAGFEIEDVDTYQQSKEMSDKEKQTFLLNFTSSPTKTTLGFLVIGGSFGEGIDLVSDRLIGVVVIGIGLPRINFESNQVAEYFKNQDMAGYDYAYTNPGINKVMQAVGRVIRSEEDKGAALLIDERYLNRNYLDLYRAEWKNYKVVFNEEDIQEALKNFYNK